MDLSQKLEESVDYHNRVNQELEQAKERVTQLETMKQQVIGRVQTYQELLQEQQAEIEAEDGPVVDEEAE